MSILNYFKAVSISVKMQKLYKRINEKAAIMDTENGESKIEKISVKLDIENPIIRINTAFKGCSSLEKISVLPRIYHN